MNMCMQCLGSYVGHKSVGTQTLCEDVRRTWVQTDALMPLMTKKSKNIAKSDLKKDPVIVSCCVGG